MGMHMELSWGYSRLCCIALVWPRKHHSLQGDPRTAHHAHTRMCKDTGTRTRARRLYAPTFKQACVQGTHSHPGND